LLWIEKRAYSDLENEVIRLQTQRERNEKARLVAESIFVKDARIQNLIRSTNDSLQFVLYIPSIVCNDCNADIFNHVLSYKQKKGISLHILTPSKQYRVNKAYFSKYNVPVMIYDLYEQETSIDQVLLFSCSNQLVYNFMPLTKDGEKSVGMYFSLINDEQLSAVNNATE
jgi:hypothetical protein